MMGVPSVPVICLENQADVWEFAKRNFEGQTGFILIRSPGVLKDLAALSQRIGPAILLTGADFVRQLPVSTVRHLWATAGLQMLVVTPGNVKEDFDELCLRGGCAGVLRATDSPSICRKAVHCVVAGELWASRKLMGRILRELITLDPDSSRRLTRRESEVLELIGLGHQNRDIASHLFVSKETVRWHIRSLYSKLGVSDRESAVRYWRLTRGNHDTGHGWTVPSGEGARTHLTGGG